MKQISESCKIRKAVLILLPFVLFVSSVYAQFYDLKFNYLTVDNGLNSNRIRCTFRDSKNFLWVGTEYGLNRFDGTKVQTFDYLGGNVRFVFEDSKQNIWIGSNLGIYLFDKSTDTFQGIPLLSDLHPSTEQLAVTSIVESKSGDFWLSTYNGLVCWNPATKKSQQFLISTTENNEATNKLESLSFDSNGGLWLVSKGNKLWKFSMESHQFSSFSIPLVEPNSANENRLIVEPNGTVWVGTSTQGLFSYNQQNQCFTHYNYAGNHQGTNGKEITGFFIQDKRFLLIAMNHGGLNRLDLETGNFEYCTYNEGKSDGLNNDGLWSVYIDQEGILYVGTSAGGVNIHNPKMERFNTFRHNSLDNNSLVYNVIWCFYEDSNGLIWIGTDGGGVSVFNPKTKTFTNYRHNDADQESISGNAVLGITEDQNHDIWLGTWGAGLNKFDRNTGKFTHYLPNPNDPTAISSTNIYGISTDENGNLWLANMTPSGLDIFDVKKGVIQKYLHNPADSLSLPDNVILRIVKQKDNVMGFISRNHYSTFDEKSNSFHNRTFNNKEGFTDVIQDKSSNTWITTQASGVIKIYPNGKSEKINEIHGFSISQVGGLLEDNDGNIWISSALGLTSYNDQSKKFQQFTAADGLKAAQFTNFAKLKASDGTLYFGGYNGFNSFKPDQLNPNNFIPQVYIDEFQIFNETVTPLTPNSPLKQTISETKEIVLSYKQSVFSFGFTSINFTYPEKARYAYQMEGYDEKWNFTTADRRYATYTNLNPGTYTFKVKACNNDGLWNETPTCIKLIITPPFWKTWWAYGFYFLLISGILYLFLSYSLIRHGIKTKLELERLEAEKKHEIDQLKLNFFANVSHEFRTPLTLITGPLDYFMEGNHKQHPEKDQKYFSLMKRNADRLLQLISKVLDFGKLDSGFLNVYLKNDDLILFLKSLTESFTVLAERKNIEFITQFNKLNHQAWFDPDLMDKIVFNLLSNAFKFTPENGRISFETTILEGEQNNPAEMIEIVVKDNGTGIAKDQQVKIFDRFYQADNQNKRTDGSGVGLALVKELVELLHGKIKLESQPGKGTCFTVWMPITQDVSNDQLINQISISQTDSEPDATSIPEYHAENFSIETTVISEKPLLLIVEDNPEMQLFVADILMDNYEIITANNGKAGMEKAFECIPDLIVSDVMMPDMDGVEMCRILRADERTNHIPIIMLTARSSEVNQLEGLIAGADDYISKPFSPKILQLKVNNILKSSQLLREKFSFSTTLAEEDKTPSLDDLFIQKVMTIVEKYIGVPELDPQQVADEIGLSRAQLYRKLKAITNQTVNDFIFTLRMNAASKILLAGELNISEVAYRVGFKTPAHFSRIFSTHFGMSPSKYIEKH